MRPAAQHHQTPSSGQQARLESDSNASLEVVGVAAGTAGTHILADAQIAVLVPGLLAFIAVVRALAIRVHLAGQQLQRCKGIVQILKPSVPCQLQTTQSQYRLDRIWTCAWQQCGFPVYLDQFLQHFTTIVQRAAVGNEDADERILQQGRQAQKLQRSRQRHAQPPAHEPASHATCFYTQGIAAQQPSDRPRFIMQPSHNASRTLRLSANATGVALMLGSSHSV